MSVESIPFKDIYCAGDIVSIVTPTYEPSSFPDIMHQWNPASSIDSDLENLNLVLIMDETTTYTRTTTNRACTDVTSITLEVVDPELLLTWTDTTICAGDQIEIMELLGEDNFNWIPTQQVASGGDTNNPTLAPSSDVTYTVTATISDCPASATAMVTVAATPIVNIDADPAGDVAIGTEVTFTANVANPTPGDQYIWTYNGTVQTTTTQTIVIQMLEEGLNNNISVSVVNESGCENVANLDVNGTIPDYRTPNAFTPDGDGLNDYFNITYIGQIAGQGLGPIEVIQFSIWNRWGNLVYDNDTPDTGWDGTYDGEPAPSDVYIYSIQVRLPNGEIRNIKSDEGSDVTLIR